IFHQFAESPEKLLHDLVHSRALLVEAYSTGADADLGDGEIARLIALIQGHFFWRHFEAGTPDFLLQRALGLLSAETLAEGEDSMRPGVLPPPKTGTALAHSGRRPIWIEPAMRQPPSPEVAVGIAEIEQLVADLAGYC